MPSFHHKFEPAAASTLGSVVDLDIQEIEDAGVREVLQTPGAALGNWGLLGALLQPGTTDFVFREPLGQAREVKTAVSGLFGRFVARAYATRYLGYSHFVHVTKPPMPLSGAMHGQFRRNPRTPKGDLPDWVVWGSAPGLGIVEAKGCHDAAGPAAALERARRQALRGDITVEGRRARFKRYAIATRWGYATPVRTRPMLWVHDPETPGDESPEEATALAVGVARLHTASLLRPLGYGELARELVALVRSPFPNLRERARDRARATLARAPSFRIDAPAVGDDDLLGGIVTRGGPLDIGDLSADDRDALARLKLGPTFVGIDRVAVERAVEGAVTPADDTPETRRRAVADDGAGGRIIRLDRERGVVRRT